MHKLEPRHAILKPVFGSQFIIKLSQQVFFSFWVFCMPVDNVLLCSFSNCRREHVLHMLEFYFLFEIFFALDRYAFRAIMCPLMKAFSCSQIVNRLVFVYYTQRNHGKQRGEVWALKIAEKTGKAGSLMDDEEHLVGMNVFPLNGVCVLGREGFRASAWDGGTMSQRVENLTAVILSLRKM